MGTSTEPHGVWEPQYVAILFVSGLQKRRIALMLITVSVLKSLPSCTALGKLLRCSVPRFTYVQARVLIAPFPTGF